MCRVLRGPLGRGSRVESYVYTPLAVLDNDESSMFPKAALSVWIDNLDEDLAMAM